MSNKATKYQEKINTMKLDFVSDDNESVDDEVEQYGTDGEDDDSLAAMASDEDNDYTEFVHACGRSLCSEAHPRDTVATPTSSRPTSIAPAVVTPPRKQYDASVDKIMSEQKPILAPRQVSYGPDGLVFNMNEPWERSLQRQIQSGLKDQHIIVNDKNNTLLLGHTESRDYAMEVNRDDVSLGTNASSTVPHRMQVIHRSFHNQNMMQQPPPPPTNHRYSSRPVEHNEEFEEFLTKNEAASRVGDVVKGCRSVDESTVSYLTNQFGNYEEFRDETQYSYSNNHMYGSPYVNDQVESRSHYINGRSGHPNGGIPSSKNRGFHSSGNSSNNHYGGVPIASSLQKSRSIRNDPNHSNRRLEMEASVHDEANSTTNDTANSMYGDGIYSNVMAPDPSCFCMGYDMLNYVLPPVYAPDVVHRSSRRYTVPRARLARVDENSKTSNRVIDLTRPDDGVNYLRYNGPQSPNTRSGRDSKIPSIPCNDNYCGIDV